jgi:F-type H+-transporting ATPase subunit epsilon
VVTGILRIKDEKGLWKEAFITSGVLEVQGSRTVLLTEQAEWPDEINVPAAEKARQEALAVLDSGTFKFETENAKAKLRRAEARLALAGKQSGN